MIIHLPSQEEKPYKLWGYKKKDRSTGRQRFNNYVSIVQLDIALLSWKIVWIVCTNFLSLWFNIHGTGSWITKRSKERHWISNTMCFLIYQIFHFGFSYVFLWMHAGRMNGVAQRHGVDGYDDSDHVHVNAGQMNSAGRGRGRGGRSYRSNRYDKGPQIDTWTNETAENAEKENTSWGEVSEDWTADEWTGSVRNYLWNHHWLKLNKMCLISKPISSLFIGESNSPLKSAQVSVGRRPVLSHLVEC